MKLPALLSSLLLSTSLLTACGTDAEPDPDQDLNAEFSSADELHRARAISTALGFDYGMAYFVGAAYSGLDEPDGCPRIVTDGSVTTVTGGCDGDSGRFDGRIVLDNVPQLFGGEDANDPTKPQVLTFEAFETEDEDGAWTIDGEIRLADLTQVSAQLALGIDGLNASSDLRMTCEAQDCTAGAGSWVDVEGVGTASVSGTWNLDSDDPSGKVTLTGAEVLVVDLDAAADGCIPYSIDGAAAGELCDDEN